MAYSKWNNIKFVDETTILCNECDIFLVYVNWSLIRQFDKDYGTDRTEIPKKKNMNVCMIIRMQCVDTLFVQARTPIDLLEN